jgi:hypothetical protein
MYIDFNQLPENSRLWIYGSSRIIHEEDKLKIHKIIFPFLQNWQHHGKTLSCSYTILNNHFLIVGLDETINPTGGCSMDGLQNIILKIDNNFNFNFFERLNVFLFLKNEVKCISSKDLNQINDVDQNSLIFNLNIEKKQDINGWLIPIRDSWCKRFLN